MRSGLLRDWADIAAQLAREGIHLDLGRSPTALGGGDISAAFRVAADGGDVFMKCGRQSALDMFSAEAAGLDELRKCGAVRVPRPLYAGDAGDGAVLVLEWLDLAPPDADVNRHFGERLAQLHRRTASAFGWHRDNTIGRTPQPNDRLEDWVLFFRRYRLEHQLRIARTNGYTGELQDLGAYLCDYLAAFFDGYEPQPSLLHGDLWGGNWAACDGEPAMYDPAVYFGDRETDLAMTRLFGGFSGEFYRAYEAAWPLAEGHEVRCAVYQLYHVLNHLNLFGEGYLGRSLGLLRELCDQID